MAEPVLISICIPAYKRVDFLQRLFDSILIQTFRDFEVVVTDDSPDGSVSQFCSQYKTRLPLTYHRNTESLGTPENWNKAISLASGAWIKLMHDDDWFTGENSLAAFAEAIKGNPGSRFIFSGYFNVNLETGEHTRFPNFRRRFEQLKRHPELIVAANIIGPPSVVIYPNGTGHHFDKNLQWLVDIDFYRNVLPGSNPVYVDQALINVGISGLQVTQKSFGRPEVEIPEYIRLLDKRNGGDLKNWLVYDSLWRLVRNLNLRNTSALEDLTGRTADLIRSMIRWQSNVPAPLLKTGVFSKLLMYLHSKLIRFN